MIEVNKRQNENGYHFLITTYEGQFEILFAGNLDLYWRNIYQGSLLNTELSKSFTITKENYFLYNLFEQIYEDVKNCNIYKMNDNIDFYENIEELEATRKQKEKMNQNLKIYQEYDERRLFKNDSIEWHCDDFPYDEASVLKISKEEEKFIVTFEKSKEVDGYMTYSVRFRNSGSRYEPFNMVFMKMYHALIEYDCDYHQMRFEEYLYQKKLQKH